MPQLKMNKNLLGIGILLIALALSILAAVYYPVAREELKYTLTTVRGLSPQTLCPESDDLLVIPSLGICAAIIHNVDPLNSFEYQKALTRGVAHAQGTALPGEKGNIFLFAHSSANFLEASRYNSIFYLLHKLQNNDEIKIQRGEQVYKYRVTSKETVSADATKYLSQGITDKLTLMTCWPPGTTFKRLVVTAVPDFTD